MKRFLFTFSVLFILLASTLIQWGGISIVKASPDIHQGDLILQGNNVTIIEGWFAINGSIVVEDDATLILRDANVSFVQSGNYQHNMTLRSQGNLTVENTTLTASDYWLRIDSLESSSAEIDGLETAWKTSIVVDDSASALISNLTGLYMLSGYGHSVTVLNGSQMQILACVHSANVTLLNSRVTNNLLTNGNSTFKAQNSEIALMRVNSGSVNCSIDGLVPGFYSLWTFDDYCSVETSAGSQLPNVSLLECQVSRWEFRFEGASNVQAMQSELRRVSLAEESQANIHNSSIEILFVDDNAVMRLVNSTFDIQTINENASLNISWYLDIHAVDSIGQDVPSANVTIRYPNATIVESELADGIGRVATVLMEKMMNATGEYPIGAYTVEAIYGVYSNNTAVTMMGNQQLILELEGFIIPELPYFAILPLFMIAVSLATLIFKKHLRL